jgi:4-hydroxybenzoate polyprenyltransferase
MVTNPIMGSGSLSTENFILSPESVYDAIGNLFSFLSVSSLWISGLGFFKTFIAYIFLGMIPSTSVCIEVFLIAFCVYSLDKIVDLDKDVANMPKRRSFLYGRRKLIISCSFAAYLVAIILTLLDKPLALPIVFIPFISNAFYGTKLCKGIPRLKDIPIMKNIIVALSWALVTTLLPAMHLANPAALVVALVVYFMLTKTFIDTVLYDIRDIKGDRENGIRTMATLLEGRRTVIVLLAVNSSLLPWLAFVDKAIWPLALVLILYGYACILYFKERRNPLILDFFVEGEWILASIVLLAFRGFGVPV